MSARSKSNPPIAWGTALPLVAKMGTVFMGDCTDYDNQPWPMAPMPSRPIALKCPYCGAKQDATATQVCTQCGGNLDAEVL